jgi:RES domain-containing protein
LNLVYRVLRREYARNPFDGEGAYRFGGRWSSPGTRLSYTSEHQSLAMLEYFVHVDKDDPPDDLVLAAAEIPHDLTREQLQISRLPANWRDLIAPAELARFGDDFAQRGEHSILMVPSVLAPSEHNCLINPKHRDSSRIVQRGIESLSYDPRIFPKRHARRKRSRP